MFNQKIVFIRFEDTLEQSILSQIVVYDTFGFALYLDLEME